MLRDEFVKIYWRYYLVLEEHFHKIEKYVEFTEDNYSTYSMEFISCLMEIGSEIDGVMKNICGFSATARKTINDYISDILEKYPDIREKEVLVRNMVILPFQGWSIEEPAKSLEWWQAYNNVKHGRSENYQQANLKNVIHALAALFLLEMYRIKEIANIDQEMDIPEKESEIFRIKNWENRWMSCGDLKFCEH